MTADQSQWQYHDPDAVKKIKNATEDNVHFAFDSIANLQSSALCVNVLASGPGKIVVVLPVGKEVQSLRKDVDMNCESCIPCNVSFMCSTAFGML